MGPAKAGDHQPDGFQGPAAAEAVHQHLKASMIAGVGCSKRVPAAPERWWNKDGHLLNSAEPVLTWILSTSEAEPTARAR